MSLSSRRAVPLTALALACGTSLAAIGAAGPAGAATPAPAYYSGATSGDVLGLTVKLPTALPNLPNPLSVGLIHIAGSATHDPLHLAGSTAASAESTASLASGSLVAALQKALNVNINRVAHVSLASGTTHDGTSLLDIPAQPVGDVSVGTLTADLTKATEATSSAANEIKATIGTGDDLLGTATVSQIQGLLTTATSGTQPVVDQIQSTVNQVLGALPTTPVSGTVDQAVDTVKATVNTVLTKVNTLVQNLGTTPLVTVDVHDATQRIAPSGNGVASSSTLGLVSVDLLGGLLTVDGFHNSASSFANGLAHGATASYSATAPIVKVNAADALCAQLDTTGISLCNVDSLGLPANLVAQIDPLLTQLSSELTQVESTVLGSVVKVTQTAGTKSVSADGKTATATAPSYNVYVGDLLTLGLGTGVTASAAAAQAPVTHIVSNPQLTDLPHTGANLGLIGALGAVALLGAAIVRRRVLG